MYLVDNTPENEHRYSQLVIMSQEVLYVRLNSLNTVSYSLPDYSVMCMEDIQ